MKRMCLFCVLFVLAAAGLSEAATVTLEWNPVATADGYKVYCGTASGQYGTPDDVGNQTTHTLTLGPGTYYFAVTACNSYGESGYSSEVSGTIGQKPPPPTGLTGTITITLEDGQIINIQLQTP